MGQRLTLSGIGFLALALWWSGVAADTPLPPGAFAAPVLDGVGTGALAEGSDLVAYRFEGGRDWPALRFYAPTPLDWSQAGALAVAIDNPADDPFELLLRLDDDAGADGGDASLTGTVTIAPHARVSVLLPLDAGPLGGTPLGMRGRPPSPTTPRPGDLIVAETRGAVNLRHIVALHISGTRTTGDRTLSIGQPMLRAAAAPRRPPGPLADAFGQWTQGHWPEKVGSARDLRDKLAAASAEARRLGRGAVPAVDAFGGVDAAVRLPATGFFRTAKVGGRWAFVTPAGYRFFSLGVDNVTASNPTVVAGRARLFAATAGASSGTIDVGAANLERGLGPGWRDLWPKQVLGRLRSWGFNTLGTWSEAAVTQGARMAYVAFTDVEGDGAKVLMGAGRSLVDPFDPGFPAQADAVAARMTAATRQDPYLLGYFSGNELPWGRADRPEDGIAAHVMALGRDSPAKRALVEELRARYGTPEALAAAHGLPAPVPWDDLLGRSFAWPSPLGAATRRDMAAFGGRFAGLYFETVAAALKRHDPNHLYLGTRLAAFPPEVMAACARWCDVVSVNVYGTTPEEEASAWRGLDRPVLIGEFHFGSTDRGSFWPGMVAVRDEAARGPAYAAYVAAAVADPAVVGAHWFQYADEPLTGRPYDGENGHIGLVAVTDVPYAGFVAAVAAANRDALDVFAGRNAPPPQAETLGLRGTQ